LEPLSALDPGVSSSVAVSVAVVEAAAEEDGNL